MNHLLLVFLLLLGPTNAGKPVLIEHDIHALTFVVLFIAFLVTIALGIHRLARTSLQSFKSNPLTEVVVVPSHISFPPVDASLTGLSWNPRVADVLPTSAAMPAPMPGRSTTASKKKSKKGKKSKPKSKASARIIKLQTDLGTKITAVQQAVEAQRALVQEAEYQVARRVRDLEAHYQLCKKEYPGWRWPSLTSVFQDAGLTYAAAYDLIDAANSFENDPDIMSFEDAYNRMSELKEEALGYDAYLAANPQVLAAEKRRIEEILERRTRATNPDSNEDTDEDSDEEGTGSESDEAGSEDTDEEKGHSPQSDDFKAIQAKFKEGSSPSKEGELADLVATFVGRYDAVGKYFDKLEAMFARSFTKSSRMLIHRKVAPNVPFWLTAGSYYFSLGALLEYERNHTRDVVDEEMREKFKLIGDDVIHRIVIASSQGTESLLLEVLQLVKDVARGSVDQQLLLGLQGPSVEPNVQDLTDRLDSMSVEPQDAHTVYATQKEMNAAVVPGEGSKAFVLRGKHYFRVVGGKWMRFDPELEEMNEVPRRSDLHVPDGGNIGIGVTTRSMAARRQRDLIVDDEEQVGI